MVWNPKTLVIISFQSDFRVIEEWAEKWLVNFNVKKTQLMTISHKKSKSINDDITFVLYKVDMDADGRILLAFLSMPNLCPARFARWFT